MKIIYTNISPITKAYTNINHFFYLKKQNPQKVYLCVWDSFVYESHLFGFDRQSVKEQKLQENVALIEKLMEHLKIDYKIIYLSEAWSRLFRNPNLSRLFQKILSSTTLEQIKEGFSIGYIPFGDIDLSRINYIIADYMIATYLPELFPEICNSQPTHYLTSERFKVFQENINHILKTNFTKYSPPNTIFVTNVPVIIHPEKKIIPSIEMSPESIRRIAQAHYKELPTQKEMHDFAELLLSVLDSLEFKGKKVKDINFDKINYYNEFIDFVSINLYNYFNKINEITAKIETKNKTKSLYVSNYDEFYNYLKPLNNIKFGILKHCNGDNTSLDISKKTGLKLSTVSTYLTQMKHGKLVDNEKKPKRLIDSFVIDVGVMENAE